MCVDNSRIDLSEAFSGFAGTRYELIPILQSVQDAVGYLPPEAMKEIAGFLSIPESQVYGVATFYAQFYFTRRGRNLIKICCGTACHVRGGLSVLETIERELGVSSGETTADYKFSLERVACVGSCALAPVVMINDDVHGRIETRTVKDVIGKYE
ncbi:MAG TPA: NADH-quinone oxidoreductase subunit NuoE [Candidatus Limnocylindrales bacterium]|nr:NADH-quinone oxidoreductase subunit NuoE [Candidatus Limnocylindrales bacterium]